MSDNNDLREGAKRAIANYMHHELFEIIGKKPMAWAELLASEIMESIDNTVTRAKLVSKTARKGDA